MIELKCPNCNFMTEAEKEWIGRTGECPECETTFVIDTEQVPINGNDFNIKTSRRMQDEHGVLQEQQQKINQVEINLPEKPLRSKRKLNTRAKGNVNKKLSLKKPWKYWGEAQMLPCPFCGKDMERIRLQASFSGIDEFMTAAANYDTSKGGKHIEQECENCGKIFESRLAPDAQARCHGKSFHQWRNIKQEDGVNKEHIMAKAKTEVNKPDMVYFECTRPSGNGTCSDDSCPCGFPGTNIPRGSGYFYISKELVEMRRDALTVVELQDKIQKMQSAMGTMMLSASSGVLMPILMCEQGAKKRGLNLKVAAADAKHWWSTGLAPLRATPQSGQEYTFLEKRYQANKGKELREYIKNCCQCNAELNDDKTCDNCGWRKSDSNPASDVPSGGRSRFGVIEKRSGKQSGCGIGCLTVLIILILLVWMGNSEWLNWDNAKREDTVERYEKYLFNFPQGKHKQEAEARIKEIKEEK